MSMRSFLILASAGFPAVLAGQTMPIALSESREIALARSAAPASVSGEATVLVLRGNRFEVAVEGTSGVSCMVGRSRIVSLEPICYDEEASRTIMQIEIRLVEALLEGRQRDEVEAEIAEAIGRGELPIPSRPAVAYMLSSGQILISDDGTNVGAWRPHYHTYIPFVTAADLGLSGPPDFNLPFVDKEGEPTASIITVLSEFVDPES